MENLKSTARHPKTSESMATNIGSGDYVPDIYPYAKLHYDPIRRFCPRIGEVAYQIFTRLFFFFGGGFFQLATSIGCCADLIDQYVTHFSKKRNFSVDFRRDLDNFGSKRALTWRLYQ